MWALWKLSRTPKLGFWCLSPSQFSGWWLVQIWLWCWLFCEPQVHILGCIVHFFEKLCLRPIWALWKWSIMPILGFWCLKPSQFPGLWLVQIWSCSLFYKPQVDIRRFIFHFFRKIVSEVHTSHLKMVQNAKLFAVDKLKLSQCDEHVTIAICTEMQILRIVYIMSLLPPALRKVNLKSDMGRNFIKPFNYEGRNLINPFD